MAEEQSFEDAVNEYIERTKAMIGTNSLERIPEPPYDSLLTMEKPWEGPGLIYGSPIVATEEAIQRYCRTSGESNPLFTDPAYAATTRYGCQLCPHGILARVRYLSVHGARRPGGYPVANFISGGAWEHYDVLRVGDAWDSAQTMSEFLDKKGSRGRLLFLIGEVFWWNLRDELVAKCYSTQIMVPMRSMGAQRAMPVEQVGKELIYSRNVSQYSAEEVAQVVQDIEREEVRGAEPRYWEDVQVGDKLPPVTLPPHTIQDMTTGGSIGPGGVSFERDYLAKKAESGRGRHHPVTNWPYSGSEHDDSLIAPYRGQRAAFDHGIFRAQWPQRLFTNWMGDDGFLRAWYIAFRKVLYYGDLLTFNGEVVKKYRVTETGIAGPGGVPGEAEYCAVGIKYAGVNQLGEASSPGTATVYLSSREYGPVQLPIPHAPRPPYVPFDTHRRDWYIGSDA
jgi:acyl dehydratase